MTCKWCYVPFGRGAPKRDTCEAVIRRLMSEGVTEITIGGGDPSSYPFWVDLVRLAHDAGTFVHLDTNGIGIVHDAWTSHAMRSYVDLIGLPLDGPDAPTHDDVRSASGHFERTLSNIRWAGSIGTNVKINTIVTRVNIARIHEMIGLVHELAPVRWSLYQYWPLSLGAVSRKRYEVDDEEFARLLVDSPINIGRAIVELNPRLSRRLTYPIVSHAGDVYVHSPTQLEEFVLIGSIFSQGVLSRAFDICVGDRPLAKDRYSPR